MLSYTANSEADTDRLAAAMANQLPSGTLVVLTGTLGAGKTHFVRSFAAAKSIDRDSVTSPTYVLCQHYSGEIEIGHLDIYRLNNGKEFQELGVDEIMDSSDVTFIEWGERVANELPKDRIDIRIEIIGASARRFDITAVGEHLIKVVDQLSRQWNDDATFP